MRVLVASNDLTFNPSLVAAYRAMGHEVHAGVPNFALRLGDYDLVHLHWPEELVGFGINCSNAAKTRSALDLLDWWRARAVVVGTVHNLIPHAASSTEGPEARYFLEFYKRIDVIGHFSEYSFSRYAEVFPSISPDKQVVHGLNTFEHLTGLANGPGQARQALGIPADKRVFCVIGAMRKPEEMQLLRSAWHHAGLRDAVLLLATDPPWHAMRVVSRQIDKLVHRRWLASHPSVRCFGGNLDDEMLVRVVEASDAVVVPRFGHHLNSGLVPLAMTFGTAVVAPDYGVCRERLPAISNSLYTAGDPRALAEALQRQVRMDRQDARRRNLGFASEGNGWLGILGSVWPKVEEIGRAKGLSAFF